MLGMHVNNVGFAGPECGNCKNMLAKQGWPGSINFLEDPPEDEKRMFGPTLVISGLPYNFQHTAQNSSGQPRDNPPASSYNS